MLILVFVMKLKYDVKLVDNWLKRKIIKLILENDVYMNYIEMLLLRLILNIYN